MRASAREREREATPHEQRVRKMEKERKKERKKETNREQERDNA